MRFTLVVRGNPFGEWSLLDAVRGYRICRYNDSEHGGTHLHHPETSPALMDVPVRTMQEAAHLMRVYHGLHDMFDPERFKEVMERWRSASAAS